MAEMASEKRRPGRPRLDPKERVVQMTLTVRPGQLKRLDRVVAAAGTTMAQMVREILEAGLRAREHPALWERWRSALEAEGVQLLYSADGQCYLRYADGATVPLLSDAAALWFQSRCDREAGFGTRKFRKAASALRSWAEGHGQRVPGDLLRGNS